MGAITINAGAATLTADETRRALRRAYLNRLYEQVSRLEFTGAELQSEQSSAASFTLDQIYTALLTAEHEPRVERASQGEVGVTQRLSAVAQLNRQPRLVLLGTPGSGKSSFVNFVTLCLAGELLGDRPANLVRLTAPLPVEENSARQRTESSNAAQPWDHGALLPVRVVLRQFAATGLPAVGQRATGQHLLDYVMAGLAEETLAAFGELLVQELREVGGLVLLDGLDEVPEAEQRRGQLKQVVESFVGVFPRCRFLVTSRTYAYQQEEWRLAQFAEAMLEPFQPTQIRAFVTHWYGRFAQVRALSQTEGAGRAALLVQAILANERLLALAEQPLLLTLMANLHAFRGGSLPERREALYGAAVELLLDWWERQRVVYGAGQEYRVVQPSLLEYLKIGKTRMVAVLSALAFAAHGSNPDPSRRATVRLADLLEALLAASPELEINPRQLVEYLSQRSGLLAPEGNRVFTFPHRTFQEYLAALHLTGASYPDEVAALARQEPGRWREVLLLAGAHAATGTESPAWELAEALLPEEVGATLGETWGALLAGQVVADNVALGQVRPRNQAKLARVRRGLVYVLEQSALPAVERALAGRTLARLGDPRPGAVTVAGMPFCYVPAGAFYPVAAKRRSKLAYGYWVGRWPVTHAQFGEFVAAGGYGEKRWWQAANKRGYWEAGRVKFWQDGEARNAPYDYGAQYTLANQPVVGVTWYEAVAFCNWLTAQIEDAQWAVRLPTEAEWTKAARGGVEIPAETVYCTWEEQRWQSVAMPVLTENLEPQRLYPVGRTLGPEQANYVETQINSPSAVGCFAQGASPYGVEELSGNVWEWLEDEDGRQAGGAYWSDADDVTSAARLAGYPSFRGEPLWVSVCGRPQLSLTVLVAGC